MKYQYIFIFFSISTLTHLYSIISYIYTFYSIISMTISIKCLTYCIRAYFIIPATTNFYIYTFNLCTIYSVYYFTTCTSKSCLIFIKEYVYLYICCLVIYYRFMRCKGCETCGTCHKSIISSRKIRSKLSIISCYSI